MKIRMFLILAFLCMGFATRASAQMYTADSDCSWDFSPDDGTIYTTATVEGQVFVAHAPQRAVHTYTVSTSLNGVWQINSDGPTSDYVSVTNYQQATIDPDQLISYSCGETVDCNMMGEVYNEQDNYTFPTVDVSQLYAGSVQGTLLPAYEQYIDPLPPVLGPLIAHSQYNNGCGFGYETVGAVNPPDSDETIIFQRWIVDQALYVNGVYNSGLPAYTDDQSAPQLQQSDPQADPNNPGTVFDLDAPLLFEAADGNIDSYRTNFTTLAFDSDIGIPVSAPFDFFVRFSCQNTPALGYQLVVAVPGDLQAGPGITNITYDLGVQ